MTARILNLLCIVCFVLLPAVIGFAAEKPNFVLIFIDDMGYGDIGPYGSTLNRTPNLDRMAAEGMKLTSFYAAPVCSASRAQLLTGCYAPRVSVPGVFFPAGPKGLNPKEHTVAEYLRDQGYATTCVGKWHLGDQLEFLPTEQGFDHYFGIPYSNDMQRNSLQDGLRVVPLLRDSKVADLLEDEAQRRVTREYTEEAVAFIENNRDGPFFLYLPHTAMHVPLFPHDDFVGKSKNGVYGDWVEEVDWSVGQVLDTIRKNKLEKNTLVIFTSDNGPWASKGAAGGVSGPLRGSKGGTLEGGVREPTIAWWPGKIKAGAVCDAITGTTDVLPTFVSLAGGKVREDIKIDGRDITPLLMGETTDSPHDAWFYYQGTRLQAVRSGPWKLAITPQSLGMGIKEKPEDLRSPGVRLYNLDEEIGEVTSVARQHPEVVARLQKLIDEMVADIGSGKAGPGVRPAGSVERPVTLYPTQARKSRAAKPTTQRSSGRSPDKKTVKMGDASGSRAAPANSAQRPNILFCIADDASFPHMGAYGCEWVKTPGFDRVAREGILFNNAYTPNAKCSPSRACILTGRNTWQLKEACNHIPYFPAEFKTYAEALAEHDYFVGKTAKGWAPGVPGEIDGKPRQLTGTPFEKRTAKPPAGGISNKDYAANFEDFLAAKPNGQPWCFWYGCYEPHRRYEYGSGVAKGGKTLADVDGVPDFWPDNETVRNDILDYALEIEHFDGHLVRMLKTIEDRGELGNTLVVVTADNGMPFPRIKGQEYELSNHLPLAVMWKGQIKSPGRVVDDYVSFIDFAPTFIEVAKLDWQAVGMKPTPGVSLTDIFNSRKSGRVNPRRDHVIFGKERHDIGRPHDWGYPIRGIVKDGMLYLHNFQTERWPAGNPETGYLNTDGSPTKTVVLDSRTDGSGSLYWQWSFGKRPQEEMFNARNDPQCMTNLAQKPKYQTLKRALKEQLFEELKAQRDPRMLGQGKIFDEYIYADQSTRNFYERYMSGEKIKAGWVNPSDFEEEPLE